MDPGIPLSRRLSMLRLGGVFFPVLAVLVWILAASIPTRVGDGTEYLLTTVAWAETGTPFITERVMERYNTLIREPRLRAAFPITPETVGRLFAFNRPVPVKSGTSYDPLHFWLLGALTAPFYWIARLTDLHFTHSYTLLYGVLWAGTTWLAFRLHQLRGALVVHALVLLSPVLWFLNKAHSECLTFFALLGALLCAQGGRLPWAILIVAVAATQNTPLYVLLAALVVLWLEPCLRAKRPPPLTEVLVVVAAMAVGALPFLYYFFRHGVLSVLADAGFASFAAIQPRKISSLFIDPDIGLFPHWPLGSILVVLLLGLVISRWRDAYNAARRYFATMPLAGYGIIFAVISIPLAQASQVNFHTGGTMHISRYAIWYIPFFYLPALFVCKRLRASTGRWIWFPVLLLTAANADSFSPNQPETYTSHTPLAAFLYDEAPGLYDPLPEVFIARSAQSPVGNVPKRADVKRIEIGGRSAFEGKVWAVGVESCRKIYVFAEMLKPGVLGPPGLPAGCRGSLSGQEIFGLAMKYRKGNDDYYFSPTREELLAATAKLGIGSRLLFSSAAADIYLGAGWSHAEAEFRWTNGDAAILNFMVPRHDLDRHAAGGLKAVIEAGGLAAPGVTQQTLFLVNGKPAGTFSWPTHQRLRVTVPVDPDAFGAVRMEIRVAHPLPPGTLPGEVRRLGLAVTSLELQPR